MSENDESKSAIVTDVEDSTEETPVVSSNDSKAKEGIAGLLENVMHLRTGKPLYFYGGIALVLVAFWFTALTPGGEDAVSAKVVIGQTYTVHNPNGGKTLLTSVPTFSSADYAGDDTVNVCVVDSGSRAKLNERTIVNYINYIRLEIIDGNCQGKSGWTSTVNIKS